MSVVLTPYQENFSWQQMKSQSKCRDGEPFKTGTPSMQLLHLKLRDVVEVEVGKCQSQKEKKFAVMLHFLGMSEATAINSHQCGYLNMSWINTAAGMLKRMRERLWRLNHTQRTMGKWGMLGAGKVVFPRENHTRCLSNTKSSALKNYMYEYTDWAGCNYTFRNACVETYAMCL